MHTPCTFKQEFVRTLCTFKHFQLSKVMVVADRGESGMGWAAIDDFEFLYDVFEVTILCLVEVVAWLVSSSGFQQIKF